MPTKPTKLFIPRFGTLLELSEAWTFQLHYEGRNQALVEALGFTFEYSYRNNVSPPPETVSLPAGTVLKVDRVYIRRDFDGKASDYDSLTFQIVSCPAEKKLCKNGSFGRKTRFWAKLEDCNNIVAIIDDTRKVNKPTSNKKATEDIRPGDFVTIDYATGKALCPYVTRELSRKIFLFLTLNKEGDYVLFSTNAANLYQMDVCLVIPKGIKFVVVRHTDDIRGAVLKWASLSYDGRNARQIKCDPEKWVDGFLDFAPSHNQSRWGLFLNSDFAK